MPSVKFVQDIFQRGAVEFAKGDVREVDASQRDRYVRRGWAVDATTAKSESSPDSGAGESDAKKAAAKKKAD